MTELEIKELVFITIDTFRAIDPPPPYKAGDKLWPIPATHQLISTATGGANIRYGDEGIEVPGADVGTLVYLKGGKLLGRGPICRVLIYGENLYFPLTWTDVIGKSMPGGREFCHSVNGKKAKYLRIATKEQYELVMDACIKSGKII